MTCEVTEDVLQYQNFDLTNMVTPVNVKVLAGLLEESNYPKLKSEKLIRGFTEGFTIGYQGEKIIQRFAPNLKLRIGSETVLWNKVMKEVKLGRFAGPFEEVPFKNFIQSPIGLVPKSNGDARLIFHLSYPKDGNSVNSGTPKELCKVNYPDFSEAVKLCIKAGKFCKLAKSDMQSAFRHLGLRPDQFCWLILKARNPISKQWFFFADKSLPFGSSISCKHFQDFSDCIAWIVSFRTGKDLVNYLDDFLFVALLAMMCNGQVDEFLTVCKLVNFPVALEKTFWAAPRMVFLGMMLDAENQVVALPVDKIDKALERLNTILGRKSRKVTLHELQQLCGYLNFLCRCVVPGRAFTRRLYSATAGKKKLKAHHHMRVTQEMKLDMEVWMKFLHQPEVLCRPFMDFTKYWTADELDFYTDASGKLGMGGYCENSYFTQMWPKWFLETAPSIELLELLAVTVGVLLWIHKFRNRRIVIFVDNKSVRDMLNNNSSSTKDCMVLIRIIVLECMIWNVRLFAKFVSSKDNDIADALSRAQYKRFSNLIQERKKVMNAQPCRMPEEIWPLNKIMVKKD